MRTQMHIKTDERSFLANRPENSEGDRNKMIHGPKVCFKWQQWTLCAVLITILAVSGFAGAVQQSEHKLAAAPVSGVNLDGEPDDWHNITVEEAAARYDMQREREIEILEGIIRDDASEQEMKRRAQEQKLEVVARMEKQTQIEETLMHMGVSRCFAVCADERVVLILPSSDAGSQSKTTRIIDAAATVGECEAKDVKIILVKIDEEDCATDKNLLY